MAQSGSLPGRGKNQRQSGFRRSGHDRETNRGGNSNNTSISDSSRSSSSPTSSTDLLVSSMSQLSSNEKVKGVNKKNQVSLNHLLNFSFPVREEPQNTGPVRRRRNVGYQPFNKDKFINANFRFLMSPGSNYEVFTMDPDVRVCWEDIEQVLIAVPQSCPICLQPPIAGRITKCGHVYCFHCILHYLALSESNKPWRKCPICWDAIYEKDLKSVRTVHADLDAFDQGEKEIAKQIASRQEVHLEMRLIQRSVNSTLALPRSKTFPLPENLLPLELRGQPPLEFYPDAMVFSRLMISTPGRIVAELERDIQSIEFSLEEAKSYDASMQSEEIVFFEMALDKIHEKKNKMREDAKFFPRDALSRERILRHFIEHGTEESSAQATTQSNETEPSTFEDSATTKTSHAENGESLGRSMVNSVTREVPAPKAAVGQVDPRTEYAAQDKDDVVHFEPKSAGHRQEKTPNQVTSVYYFYQAANGHHLYLQPLDIRILKQHFETYERFPDTIAVKVLGIEETSLTEEVRKKCKYLGHLPLGCEVSFLDVALEGIVGEEGIKTFEPELRLRRTRRREKEAREERERLEREHKLNPPKTRRDDFFANDPFFHVDAGANGMVLGRKNSDADLQEAIRLSQVALEESMPTLSEANARTTSRRISFPASNGSGSGAKSVPIGSGSGLSSTALELDPWGNSIYSSYESIDGNAMLIGSNLSATSLAVGTSTPSSTHTGSSTVWGTPSVPVNRHHDDYDDYYEDEHDYETEVYVKRGKKKVAVLMTNNSRRAK